MCQKFVAFLVVALVCGVSSADLPAWRIDESHEGAVSYDHFSNLLVAPDGNSQYFVRGLHAPQGPYGNCVGESRFLVRGNWFGHGCMVTWSEACNTITFDFAGGAGSKPVMDVWTYDTASGEHQWYTAVQLNLGVPPEDVEFVGFDASWLDATPAGVFTVAPGAPSVLPCERVVIHNADRYGPTNNVIHALLDGSDSVGKSFAWQVTGFGPPFLYSHVVLGREDVHVVMTGQDAHNVIAGRPQSWGEFATALGARVPEFSLDNSRQGAEHVHLPVGVVRIDFDPPGGHWLQPFRIVARATCMVLFGFQALGSALRCFVHW